MSLWLTLDDQVVAWVRGQTPQPRKQRGMGERLVEGWQGGKGVVGALVEGHRPLSCVHRGGVEEPLYVRVSFVDRARPARLARGRGPEFIAMEAPTLVGHLPLRSLPWWRWYGGIPQAFSAPNVDGNPNPLYKAHISRPNANPLIDRDTRRFPGQGVPSTVRLPTREEIGALYNITDFQQFSDGLEQIHDSIHGWTGGISQGVGGDMGTVATAAYDPIFWVHHCMIDCVWHLWQLRNGVNNIPAEYMDVLLAPFRYTVRDVLNVNALGYEYGVACVA